MATTPVLGLRKPARADLVSVVTDINNNMDILDQAYDDLSTVSLNIAMTIPANVWSENAPYTYTWLDSRISQKCDIEVGFFSGAESSDLMYLAYEKVPFGIKFTASNKPTTGVPLTIKIINAEAESITSVTGDMVTTSVIPGAANADEALSVLNNNLTTLSSKFATVTGTLPATVDTYVAVAFPSGFNSDNCCIIGHMEYASNGASWYSNNPNITVLSEKVQGIRIKTSDSTFTGQSFKINLMKI